MVECERCHRKLVNYAALKQHYRDQHPNAKWNDALQEKLNQEEKLQAYKATIRPTRQSHTKLIIGVILIAVVIGAGAILLPGLMNTPSTNCSAFPFPTIADLTLAEHYHAILMIYANGQQIPIPANVGEGDSGPCIQPLHVHANSPNTSVIHIESPVLRNYTLGDFFRVWAATPNLSGPTIIVFNQNQIFSYQAGNGYQLRMYVNGQESNQFDSLTLQQHQVIVIVYGNGSTNWSQYQTMSAESWPYPDL